jgi:hypothetical protein
MRFSFLLMLIGPSLAAGVEIPEQFRGAYTCNISEPGSCRRATIVIHEDDGAMNIEARRITWWESICDQ